MKKLFLTLNFLTFILLLSVILHASGNTGKYSCANHAVSPKKHHSIKERTSPSVFDGITPHILLF